MNAAVIVPFHSPSWVGNVAANLHRQTVGLPVVLAVNGAAAGVTLPWPAVESDRSHAAAVNAGAEWARQRGFTHAVCLDSDDYYAPDYVARQLSALESAAFVGKRSVFVWLSDGLHLFERSGGRFLGGTIAFSLRAFLPMRAVLQDDTDWCERMAASGAVRRDTGPRDYCYVRHGSNAHWRAGDVELRRAWGPSHRYPTATIADVSREPGGFEERPRPSDAEVFAALGDR